jgi:hypothetical protein
VPHAVFISYPEESFALADHLVALLEADQILCWIAPRDVPPGASWPVAASDAVKTSRLMLALVSQHTIQSKRIVREVALADSAGIAVIPVAIEEVELYGDLKTLLESRQWINLFPGSVTEHAARFVFLVSQALALLQIQKGALEQAKIVYEKSIVNLQRKWKQRAAIWAVCAALLSGGAVFVATKSLGSPPTGIAAKIAP